MEKTIYILHHCDLDGVGVKVLGTLYAQQKGMPFSTSSCSYRNINAAAQAVLKQDDVAELIIGDISVNEEMAEQLDQAYKTGMKIRLFDHHESALSLNKYEWAHVVETDKNGVDRSGTWVMAQDPDFQPHYQANQFMMDTIDDWDTWNWKVKNNIVARQLNSLLDILGESEFTEYMLSHISCDQSNIFDHDIQIMLDTQRKMVVSQAETCIRNMYTVKLWTQVPYHKDGVQRRLNRSVCLKTGIVFVQSNISEVGDVILDKNPDLDALMMIIFPNTISWRTQKQLPVSLSRIAIRATGKGGGHPSAAGSTISFSVFQDMLTKFMEDSFDDTLEFSNLLSPYIRKLREAERAERESANDTGEVPPDNLLPS